jgi:hypothetical protein
MLFTPNPVISAGRWALLYSTKLTRRVFTIVSLFAFFYVKTEFDRLEKSAPLHLVFFTSLSYNIFSSCFQSPFLRTVLVIFLSSEMTGLLFRPFMLLALRLNFVGNGIILANGDNSR